MNIVEYSRFIQPNRRALARLRLDLQFFLEESEPILLVTIEDRLKSFESAIKKSQLLGIDISHLDDLAGLRVVVSTLLDAELICQFFRTGLRGTSFNVLKDNTINDDGYRAHHIVIELPENYTGTWQTCKVEVQVHTILQNAFNRLSRAWLYKSRKNLPVTLKSKFQEFSEKLQILDSVASDLQQDLFGKSVNHSDDDPLTSLAYKDILLEVLGESTSRENAIWCTLFYRRLGIETCAEMRSFFCREDIHQMFDDFKIFPSKYGILTDLAKTKEEFWQMIGTRIEYVQQLLQQKLGES
jgi:ppGpp synthetase/RelA/SpoT-type nucleotidyltranferase